MIKTKRWKQFSDAVDSYNRYIKSPTHHEKEIDREVMRANLIIPRSLHEKLRREKFETRKSINSIIRELVEAHYRKEPPKQIEKTLPNYYEWECGKLDLTVE